jgi:hypothetical protein
MFPVNSLYNIYILKYYTIQIRDDLEYVRFCTVRRFYMPHHITHISISYERNHFTYIFKKPRELHNNITGTYYNIQKITKKKKINKY